MIVDLVFQACHAGRIGTGLTVEPDRSATGKDEPVPCKKHTALPGDDLAVILANKARALRDQENAARKQAARRPETYEPRLPR